MYSYIKRVDDLCIIQLFVPNAKKDDFSVYIEDHILNVVYTIEDEEVPEIPPFTKQYAISQHVIKKNVNVIYETGILTIKLPLGSMLDDTNSEMHIQ